jgi:regulatory protein
MNQEYIQKLEYYCAYQERCHQEVHQKMIELKIPFEQKDALLVHLIENNFLNEERFAQAFARGKHRIKKWGKNRIVQELKLRKISPIIIKKAILEIDETQYKSDFEQLANKYWEEVKEKNLNKKKSKVMGFLIRKGYETDWVYDFLSSK